MDLKQYIQAWALKYGFSAEQVDQEVRGWVAEVQATSTDFHQLGLAAFAEKEFEKASEMFGQSAAANEVLLREMAQEEERLQAEARRHRENIIRDWQLAGDAYTSDNKYKEALEAYRKAHAFADRETMPRLWAVSLSWLGYAIINNATMVEGQNGLFHLEEAERVFREALTVVTSEALPVDWAKIIAGLGKIREFQAELMGGHT